MKPVLREFVRLLESELAPSGFVRRGPVFRWFTPNGNGIVLDIQQTAALHADAAFFVNVGLMFGPLLTWSLGDGDPLLEAMPANGIWHYRIVATRDGLPDHRFSLRGEADADRAFQIVQAWLSTGLPKLRGLMDAEAMLAASIADRAQSERASEEQLRTRQWVPGHHPDGTWNDGALGAYVLAERGDVAGVIEATECWGGGPGSLADDIVALALRNSPN
jgi:hypothetical protein